MQSWVWCPAPERDQPAKSHALKANRFSLPQEPSTAKGECSSATAGWLLSPISHTGMLTTWILCRNSPNHHSCIPGVSIYASYFSYHWVKMADRNNRRDEGIIWGQGFREFSHIWSSNAFKQKVITVGVYDCGCPLLPDLLEVERREIQRETRAWNRTHGCSTSDLLPPSRPHLPPFTTS